MAIALESYTLIPRPLLEIAAYVSAIIMADGSVGNSSLDGAVASKDP